MIFPAHSPTRAIPSISLIPNLLDSRSLQCFAVMKTKLVLKIAGLIGVLALVSAGYCFWLMTIPLSYDRAYAVLIGLSCRSACLSSR